MNNQITNKERNRMINNLISDIDARIDRINDLPNDGYVLQFPVSNHCVDTENLSHRDAMSSGCITRATIYTQEQLDACAEYGVGIPMYRDGTGEIAKLVPIRTAKWNQIADANRAIESLNNLIA